MNIVIVNDPSLTEEDFVNADFSSLGFAGSLIINPDADDMLFINDVQMTSASCQVLSTGLYDYDDDGIPRQDIVNYNGFLSAGLGWHGDSGGGIMSLFGFADTSGYFDEAVGMWPNFVISIQGLRADDFGIVISGSDVPAAEYYRNNEVHHASDYWAMMGDPALATTGWNVDISARSLLQ